MQPDGCWGCGAFTAKHVLHCCTCTGCRVRVLRQKESGGKIYINPQETDMQAGPSIMAGAGTVGLWVYILHRLMCRRWWRGLLQVFLGNKPAVRGSYMRICRVLSLSLSFLSLFQPQVAHPPYTTHHLFLGTLVSSYIWLSFGAVHVGGRGCCLPSLLDSWAGCTVYTSCSTSLSLFLFKCSFIFRLGQSPGSRGGRGTEGKSNGSNGPPGSDG